MLILPQLDFCLIHRHAFLSRFTQIRDDFNHLWDRLDIRMVFRSSLFQRFEYIRQEEIVPK